jgi:hypothetical protein
MKTWGVMFRNSFSSFRTWKIRKPIVIFLRRRKEDRIHACETTEFVFCNRRFGAVILDASSSGMKSSCEIKLGVGSIIPLLNPTVSGNIVWRDDKEHLIGIKFIKAALGQN